MCSPLAPRRMFWGDPVTGAPVNGEEIHKEELRNAEKTGMSQDTVTAFAGHVKMREDCIASTVDPVTSQRVLILLLTSHLPWDEASPAPDPEPSPA